MMHATTETLWKAAIKCIKNLSDSQRSFNHKP